MNKKERLQELKRAYVNNEDAISVIYIIENIMDKAGNLPKQFTLYNLDIQSLSEILDKLEFYSSIINWGSSISVLIDYPEDNVELSCLKNQLLSLQDNENFNQETLNNMISAIEKHVNLPITIYYQKINELLAIKSILDYLTICYKTDIDKVVFPII